MSVTNITDLYFSSTNNVDDGYKFLINQGDYQSRTVQANLYISIEQGGVPTPYSLTSEAVTIAYEYVNSNEEIITTAQFSCTKATSIGDNVITFLIPNIVLENYGVVKAQVKVYEDEDTLLNTCLFKFYISKSLLIGTAEDNVTPLFLKTILDSGIPNASTAGMVGQLYINIDNDDVYYCSGLIGIEYIWSLVIWNGDNDYGLITESAKQSDDYGFIAVTVT